MASSHVPVDNDDSVVAGGFRGYDLGVCRSQSLFEGTIVVMVVRRSGGFAASKIMLVAWCGGLLSLTRMLMLGVDMDGSNRALTFWAYRRGWKLKTETEIGWRAGAVGVCWGRTRAIGGSYIVRSRYGQRKVLDGVLRLVGAIKLTSLRYTYAPLWA